MSSAVGEVWSREGKLYGYFEYQGVTDLANPNVYLKHEELIASWRKHGERRCACESTGETVILYSSYGGGFHWFGKVCWHCLVITGGANPSEPVVGSEVDGHPFLDAWMIATYGKLLPCRKCEAVKLVSDTSEANVKCQGCGEHFYLWELTPKMITEADSKVVAEQ